MSSVAPPSTFAEIRTELAIISAAMSIITDHLRVHYEEVRIAGVLNEATDRILEGYALLEQAERMQGPERGAWYGSGAVPPTH